MQSRTRPRRHPGALLLALAIAGAAAACSPPTAEVGACTNQDPDIGVQVVGIEIVDCGSDEATFEIVEEVEDGSECEVGELTVDDRTFCVEPLGS